MKLYLIRHALAEERHIFAKTGQPDELRPLIEAGKKRMHKVTQSFVKMEPQLDIIFQSPLVRSQQTVEILKTFYPKAVVKTCEHLAPGHSAKKLFKVVMEHIECDSIAMIGHEPDLGAFLSWCLFRQASDHFPFKKSGIAKLDIYEDQRCYLKWFLRPKTMNA